MAISKRCIPGGREKPPTDFGSVQAADWLGIATWQFEAAVRRGLIPPADTRGRWSTALVEEVAERLTGILAQVGEHPPIGVNRAAKRLSQRLDLDVTHADIKVLVERSLLAIADFYRDLPLYDVRNLDHIADERSGVLAGIIAERQEWEAASLSLRAACAQLGWRRDELERVVSERNIQPGRFDRFVCADIEALAADRDLVKQVLSDRLLGPDQACEYLKIRRIDFDCLGLAGLILPRTTRWMQVGRYRKAILPLYSIGDLDALLDVSDLDWGALRCCKECEPSPLRELVTDRPTRAQIIRQFVAELGDRLGIEVWTYHNGATDQWEIGGKNWNPAPRARPRSWTRSPATRSSLSFALTSCSSPRLVLRLHGLEICSGLARLACLTLKQ